MASKRVPIQALAAADLGLDEGKLAGEDARCRWRSLALPQAKSGGTIIKGEEDPGAAAAQLARLLREQAKAI
jgi:electron transfer flavoprotein alpha/beta subunit